MSLFHKALVFGDPHFGRNSNNPLANKDNIDFLIWAIDEARTWGADTCIMLGDWFHNRNLVGVETLHQALKGLELISEAFLRSFFITGNHDHFYRNKRDITSVEVIKYIPNIQLINDPLTIEEVTFLPYLMPGEHKTLNLNTRYVFGHLEVSGFKSNTGHVMPDTDHSQDMNTFRHPDYCFSGHFHGRQISKNMCYIGNICPFDFSDDHDPDRGIMLLQYGREPIFRAWPEQPLYSSMKLSEMLENADTILKPKMTVRATIDVPLRYEEAQEIRSMLISNYGLRKVELLNGKLDEDQDFSDVRVQFRSIDQIVIEGLSGIESIEMNPNRLIEIYKNLEV